MGIDGGFVIEGKDHGRERSSAIKIGGLSATATPWLPAVDMRYVAHYSTGMVRSIRHRGLKRLHEDDDSRGVIREHAEKLRDILARLDAAGTIADMDVPGFRLHPLKGEYEGYWAATVRANWRVIFRFADRDMLDVDYVDYH